MKILNNNGPMIEHCGTPVFTSVHSLKVASILTLCFLLDR